MIIDRNTEFKQMFNFCGRYRLIFLNLCGVSEIEGLWFKLFTC